MPKYTLKASDGASYTLDSPNELTQDQLNTAFSEALQKSQPTQQQQQQPVQPAQNPYTNYQNLPTPNLTQNPYTLAEAQSQKSGETTAGGLVSAAGRGASPYMAAASLGALAGGPAGAAIAPTVLFAADMITPIVNSVLGTGYKTPSESVQGLLTLAGTPNADTEAERIVQAISGGAASTSAFTGLGKTLLGSANPLAQRVGQVLAESPLAQYFGGAGAAGAGQAVAEAGGGPVPQVLASLLGGVGGARAGQAMSYRPNVPVVSSAAEVPISSTIPVSPTAPAMSMAPKTEATSQIDTNEILNLARKANSFGVGATSAKQQLAEMAQINPQAKQAAENIGVDLPVDVFSDNPQVRNALGLTRAQVASEAEASWQNTARKFIERADDISKEYDATFVEGRPSTGVVSEKVLENLKQTRLELDQAAKVTYDKIEQSMPKSTEVSLDTLRNVLSEVEQNVGAEGLQAQEKGLKSLLGEKKITYARLMREKQSIGDALQRKQNAYSNMAEADLKRLYGALAEDQLNNVERTLGKQTRDELRTANLLTTKRKALEKRIVGAFGTEKDGSIAQKMQTAILTGSKGDIANFNKLMKVVPEDLQKETIATALASVTSGKAAGIAGAKEVSFSPSEFTKVYRGLRANKPMWDKITKTMGTDWERTMNDLYSTSRRVSDAIGRIPTTGKANQILAQGSIDSLMSRIISSRISQAVVSESAGKIPGLGLAVPSIVDAMRNTKNSGFQSASTFLSSPEFEKMAIEIARTGRVPSEQSLKKIATNKSFIDYVKGINIENSIGARVGFLQAAIQSSLPKESEQ
jgi:hypothetical protein